MNTWLVVLALLGALATIVLIVRWRHATTSDWMSLFLGRPEPIARRVFYVPDDFPTIQQSLQKARSGDRVVVRPGVYQENLDFLGKGIRLTSLDPNDPATVRATVLDGGQADTVVMFRRHESPQAVLEGFTITNGGGWLVMEQNILGNAARAGGGVYIGSEASPTIRHNIIRGNQADLGGGVYVTSNSLATFEANVVMNNRAILGGGVRIAWDFRRNMTGPTSSRQTFFGKHAAWLTGNTVVANRANIGGGVSVDRSASPRLENNDIGCNTAKWDGAGVAIWDNSKPTLAGNIIHDNRAGSDYGYGAGVSIVNNSRPLLDGNLFRNNVSRGRFESGGGAVAVNRSDPVLQNNSFQGNRAEFGSDVLVWGNSNVSMGDNEVPEEGLEVREYRPPKGGH